MKYQLIIHQQARQELKEARDYYKKINPDLARSFLFIVDEYLKTIKDTPFIYQIKFKNYREAVLRTFPYVIIYEVEDNFIYIDSIFNTYRNPITKP